MILLGFVLLKPKQTYSTVVAFVFLHKILQGVFSRDFRPDYYYMLKKESFIRTQETFDFSCLPQNRPKRAPERSKIHFNLKNKTFEPKKANQRGLRKQPKIVIKKLLKKSISNSLSGALPDPKRPQKASKMKSK